MGYHADKWWNGDVTMSTDADNDSTDFNSKSEIKKKILYKETFPSLTEKRQPNL